jgi:LigD, primase-polymerase domain
VTETVRLADRDIKMSKLDKEMFPADHLSNGEVIDYYRAVADVMLPHLSGRPLVLRRYPDGIGGHGFVQQEVSDHFPDWLTIARAPRRGGPGTVDHPVCDDAATLVYLVNQAAIEFHVWPSTMDKLDHPDRLVVDRRPRVPRRRATRPLPGLRVRPGPGRRPGGPPRRAGPGPADHRPTQAAPHPPAPGPQDRSLGHHRRLRRRPGHRTSAAGRAALTVEVESRWVNFGNIRGRRCVRGND